MIHRLSFSIFSVTLGILLSCVMGTTAGAQDASNKDDNPSDSVHVGIMSDSPDDPENLLHSIDHRKTQKSSLISVPALYRMYEASDRGRDKLYETTGLKLGLALTHVFQWLSESPLAEDTTWGTATTFDFLGTWELVDRGGPYQGQLFFQVQGRWEYGTTGPERLGNVGLGSLNGTANTFSAYSPFFLLRNLYWQQGSKEAGWVYRIGKITPDAMLSTSAHIASPLTFLPTAGTGPFANALTDSGLGIAAAWYINKRLKLLGIISDANANRQNFGNIGALDFYTAIELGVKIAPRTAKAGYSKITFWHTDATENGEVVNGHLGPAGWGFYLKHEQELSSDGRAVGVLRYGRSFNQSAVYEQQFGAHFVLYNPTGITRLQNDLLGLAFNWAQANVSVARGEYNIEFFYRFPLLPQLDTSLSYQAIINPALDPNNNFASVFSIRLRTTF
jgi:porin